MNRKTILISSIILTGASVTGFISMGHKKNDFVAITLLAIMAICCIPWITLFRDKIAPSINSESKLWKWIIKIQLFGALSLGPLVTSLVMLWFKIEKPTDAWGGFGPAIMAAALVFAAHLAGIILLVLGFLTQLWRNQWHILLTLIAFAYQLTAFFLARVLK